MKVIFKIISVILISSILFGCVPKTENQVLNQARYDFQSKNYSHAFNALMPLAKNNNAQAQYSIGYMYYYGLGVMENTKQAKYWIEKSAKNGNSNAIRALEIEKFPHAGL